jgi:hypothetical protein
MDNYSYAVIYLSDPVLDWLREKLRLAKKLKKEDSDFYGLEYFDQQAEYYPTLDLPMDVESGEFLKLDDTFEPGRDPQRTSASTVVITNDTITWHANSKHGNGHVETAIMTEEFLNSLDEPVPA